MIDLTKMSHDELFDWANDRCHLYDPDNNMKRAFDELARRLAAAEAIVSVLQGEPTDDDLDAVVDELGMGPGAWDMEDPKDIIKAAWKRAVQNPSGDRDE